MSSKKYYTKTVWMYFLPYTPKGFINSMVVQTEVLSRLQAFNEGH